MAQRKQQAREQRAKKTDDDYLANLSPAQKEAIEMSVQGFKDTHIARHLRLTPRTLYRWKTDDPENRDALDQARWEAHSSIADRYRSLLSRATGIFRSCLDAADKDVQFRAAYALLTMSANFKPMPGPDPDDDGPLHPRWSRPKMRCSNHSAGLRTYPCASP
jgi:hypothetical protein